MFSLYTKEKIVAICFYLVIFFIGFGSTGSGVYNNNMISSALWIYLAAFLLFFYQTIVDFYQKSLAIPILIMLTSFLISCYFSDLDDKSQNWARFYAIFFCVLFGYFSYISMTIKIIKLIDIIKLLAFIGGIHVLVLLYMWCSSSNPSDYNWVSGLYFFSHIRHLADFLSICFFAAFFLTVDSKRTAKLWWTSLTIILLSVIIWSGSRAAYVSVLFGVLCLLFFEKDKIQYSLKLLVIVVISAYISSFFDVNNSGLGGARVLGGDAYKSLDHYSSNRITLYQEVLEYYLIKPLWGHGGDAVSQLGVSNGLYPVLQAHNSILQILIEFGAIGLLCVLGVLFKVIFDLKRMQLNQYQIFSVSVIVNILVASLFNGGAYYVVTISLMCFFIAVLYSELKCKL